MNRGDIARLLTEAKGITQHVDYVIIGSLSILGASDNAPAGMTGSTDVDLYPKNDPGRASEVMNALGEKSAFSQEHGYYADAVSPYLPTLPDGWEDRLIKVDFSNGVNAWFLDVNDAAISKYVRSEDRDREWIREGLGAGFLSLPTIEYRLRETRTEPGELDIARAAIEQDSSWLERRSLGADEPAMYKRLVVTTNGYKSFETSLDGMEWKAAPSTPAPRGLRPDTYALSNAQPVDAARSTPVTGFVIHADEKYVYQEMARNNIVRHDRRSFPDLPEIGVYARLKYENGKAIDITPSPQLNRGLSR